MMEFRNATAGDIAIIKARSSKEYDKLEGPTVTEEALVGVDKDGIPRIAMTAQKVAELYMVLDHTWETPAMRWSMIEAMHREMLIRLRYKGYRVGYSFFADGVPNGYLRRLALLGWTRMIERCMRYVDWRA
jgi:hypothetical protein